MLHHQASCNEVRKVYHRKRWKNREEWGASRKASQGGELRELGKGTNRIARGYPIRKKVTKEQAYGVHRFERE